MDDQLLTAKELADKLQCSVATVHRQAAHGSLPLPVRVGKLKRWRWPDVLAALRGDKEGARNA